MGDWARGEQTTVLALFEAAVADKPTQTFLDFEGESHTYEEIWQRAASLASGLKSLAIQPGDTIATMLDNTVDSFSLWFATIFLGAIIVPVNTALRGEFLRHVISDSRARVLLIEDDLIDRLPPIIAGLPDVEHVVCRGSSHSDSIEQLRVSSLDIYRSSDGIAPVLASPKDLLCVVYTGGTTGPSKGCMLSHNFPCSTARAYLRSSGRTADEINWSPLPIFHMNVISTSLIPTMMLTSTLSLAKRFSLSGFWPEIERSGARVVNLLGSMIALVAGMPDTDEMQRCKGQIRAVVSGRFPPELAKVWKERFGIQIAGSHIYAMTECAPITSLASDEYAAPGSAGRRNELFDARIFDDDDIELQPGVPGEVCVRPNRPNSMFAGYWQRPQATVDVWRNGWFHTGDIGTFDEDGFFYFMDRKSDYMRRRGENIASYEVESTYLGHPEIVEVAAHAVPSKLTEDDVKITAVLRAESSLTARDLFEWSVERLPYYALPRYIEFREKLPMSPLGKVLKYQLREEGCTDATWDREQDDVHFERR